MQKVIRTLLCVCLLLSSCSGPGELPPAAYVGWLEDPAHGCRKKIVSGDWEYVFQLATPEMMVAKELSDRPADKATWAQRLQELKGHLFVLVQISKTEASRKANPQAAAAEIRQNIDRMVSYYDQQAMADIKLQVGTQSFAPVAYHFENNYELSPYNTIVAGFETGDAPGDITFSFNDQYTGQPLLHAGFSQKDRAQLPRVQLQP
jgi:hypothetical protein